jgi:hypothetical protein
MLPGVCWDLQTVPGVGSDTLVLPRTQPLCLDQPPQKGLVTVIETALLMTASSPAVQCTLPVHAKASG